MEVPSAFTSRFREVTCDLVRPANGLGCNNDNSLDFALVSIGLDANKPTLQMDWFGLVSRPTAVCNG